MRKWILILGCFFTLIINQNLHAFNSSASNAKAYKLLAGKMGGAGSLDGTGSRAYLYNPNYITYDSLGNAYFSEPDNNVIRKVTPEGVVTTFAGTAGLSGRTNATGAAARFYYPLGLVADASDNIYVCDGYNYSIRKITPAGVVTHFAGSTTGASGTTDGTGSAARFTSPVDIVMDASGDFYISDVNSYTIRKMTSAGVVTTFAGTVGTSGSTDGTGTAARFFGVNGLGIDLSGNIVVADTQNNTIRKITPAGVVTTFAGAAGVSGTTNGTGTAARFNRPRNVAIDSSDNIYVADYSNSSIRKITPAGVVTTFAGTSGSTGSADGTGAAARFTFPTDIAIDPNGGLAVADSYNNTIRKITFAGVVTTFAGSSGGAGTTNGTGTAASFNDIRGIVGDSSGNLYVADMLNHVIRKITPAGVVTTFAGTMGTSGSTNATGTAARFNRPWGMAIDSSGNLYVADMFNHTIRKITSAGVVTTLAGTAGSTGSTDGTGAAARFNTPKGVAVDSSGNVYVADALNSTIRKITSAGGVTTLAGSAGSSGTTNGTGSAARFQEPNDIAIDSSGDLFVVDTGNSNIRKVTSAGVVTTFAGSSSGVTGSTNATGTAARFFQPAALEFDSSGNLYVLDSGNNLIRRVSPAGVVKTASGKINVMGSSLGPVRSASLGTMKGIFIRNDVMSLCVDNTVFYAPKP